jgi:pyruvate/2-oxoglutarate/acetoin dehydrogenase E1 component
MPETQVANPAKVPTSDTTTSLRYIQAVQHALRWALTEREDTILFGEDIALPGGPFGATKGLHKEFGSERIFDTPISESGFLGMALGAAMTGLRPIAEIMYADFLFVAMDQVVNQIANVRYVTRGSWTAPLVIRTQQGYSPGACAQHSKSIESYLVHTPGIRVAVPSTPDDAYQMLRTAVDCPDPVFVVEARMLYPSRGDVRLGADVEPLGGARIVRPGTDVTVVSWSRSVGLGLEAAGSLAEEGISVEVIDMRWLNPLDISAVTTSVERTRRLVVVQEANLTGGVGSEIAARVGEACFGSLAAPVRRIGMPDLPMPAAPILQDALLPTAQTVVDAVREMVR